MNDAVYGLKFVFPAPATVTELNERLIQCNANDFLPMGLVRNVVDKKVEKVCEITFDEWVKVLQEYYPRLEDKKKEAIQLLNQQTLKIFPNVTKEKSYREFAKVIILNCAKRQKEEEKIALVERTRALLESSTGTVKILHSEDRSVKEIPESLSFEEKLHITKQQVMYSPMERCKIAGSLCSVDENDDFITFQRALSYLLLERKLSEKVCRFITLELQRQELIKNLEKTQEVALVFGDGTGALHFSIPDNASVEEIAFYIRFKKQLAFILLTPTNAMRELKGLKEFYTKKEEWKLLKVAFNLVSVALIDMEQTRNWDDLQNFLEIFSESPLNNAECQFVNFDNYLVPFIQWLIVDLQKAFLSRTVGSKLNTKKLEVGPDFYTNMKEICEAYREVYRYEEMLYEFIYNIKGLLPRKKKTLSYYQNLCPWEGDRVLPNKLPQLFEPSCIPSPEQRLSALFFNGNNQPISVPIYEPALIKRMNKKKAHTEKPIVKPHVVTNRSKEQHSLEVPPVTFPSAVEEKSFDVSSTASLHIQPSPSQKKSLQYAERVQRWFYCTVDHFLPQDIFWEYTEASLGHQQLMQRLHGFTRRVDDFIDSYALKVEEVVNQEKIVQYIIPAEFILDGKEKRGVINYCFSGTSCFHRFFHVKNEFQEWIEQIIDNSFKAIDFPELQKAIEDKQHRTPSSQKADKDTSELTIDPCFGVVTIRDWRFADLKIRLIPPISCVGEK